MLELIRVSKMYDEKPLLREISLAVLPGETLALLGASGSGKSTLLQIIAGLEKPESGDILWDGKSILDVPVHLRNFGLVFQDYALFPHLSVEENVAFGLSMRKVDPLMIKQITKTALERVKMDSFAQRDVLDLSGGEQQRIALARTLASNPRLFMFDEPLAALDRNLRQELVADLRNILQEAGAPAIYVTHDQEEAFTLADRVALLIDGKIMQTGTPQEVYQNPISERVARFLGLTNFIDASIYLQSDEIICKTALGDLLVKKNTNFEAHNSGQNIRLCLRKAEICMGTKDSKNIFSAKVIDSVFTEFGFQTTFAASNGLVLRFLLDSVVHAGDQVKLFVPFDQILIFPAGSHGPTNNN